MLNIFHQNKNRIVRFQRVMTTQSAKFVEKFTIKSELMGLAIGTHGSNLHKAREISGVTNIEVEDETCTIKIFGDVRQSSLFRICSRPLFVSFCLDRKGSKRCTSDNGIC